MDQSKIADAFADAIRFDHYDHTFFDDMVAGDMRRAKLKYHLSDKEAVGLSAICAAFAEFLVRE